MSLPTPPRKPAPTRQTLLARLHCIKHERTWSDDEYRDILFGLAGVRTAADLDLAGLSRVIAVLGKSTVQVPQAPSEWAFIDRAVEAKRPLLRKICAVCRALGVGRSYAEGIVRPQDGNVHRRLEMMATDELYRVAQALVNTQRHRQRQAEKAKEAV